MSARGKMDGGRRPARLFGEGDTSPEALAKVVRAFAGRRVLVAGDMLADHYIYGRTSRISREAPVLILKYQEERTVPGQAANTASNIAALGGRVVPVGVIGRDVAGRALKAALKAHGVRPDTLLELKGFSTLTKTRILAGGHHTCRQQVIRIDDDERLEIGAEIRAQLSEVIRREGKTADGIVVSDYGYGLVTEEVWK